MTKLHFISLGCPKNLVDSEVMLGHIIDANFVLTPEPADADVIVVNTCAFIEDAKKEAIDTILEMGEFKKGGKLKLLVVAGCLPQRYEKKLQKLLPEVDIFIGAGEFPRVAGIISRRLAADKQRKKDAVQEVHVETSTYIYDHDSPRMRITPKHLAYIKIAEGCFHPCSFCIVPKIRGKYRSRHAADIVDEVRGLVEEGVREFNIIAQDTTAYGRDIGEDIGVLIGKLGILPDPKWIRILYAYPHGFPETLIRAMQDQPDVCRYLDLPVQHISAHILKAMSRGGGPDEIKKLIEKLRRSLPRLSLRTSLIVGFPGETEDDFGELADFVCETRFEHLGVFVYSPEEGTSAAKMKGQVPREIAEERRALIMELQRELSLGNNRKYLGKRIKVLIEGASKESNMLIEGRHEGQAPDIDGVVYINEGLAAAGDFATVEITETHEYDLVGRIVG